MYCLGGQHLDPSPPTCPHPNTSPLLLLILYFLAATYISLALNVLKRYEKAQPSSRYYDLLVNLTLPTPSVALKSFVNVLFT